MNWLRMMAIDCTAGAPWRQAFPVYKTLEGRWVVFRRERPPAEPSLRGYTSPLLEARRYAAIFHA